jgi:hypothetical protein
VPPPPKSPARPRYAGAVPTEFRLRFPLSEVMYWAARYSYADDAEVEAIGRSASKRGSYTRDEFLTVTRWKTQRSRSRCEGNDEASVEATTRLALSAPEERIRIEAFTRLHGVAYPTASVLLHFARPDAYPIIDFRALWSLGWASPPTSYTFAFWWAYTLACRSLAKNAGVTVRTLDRALWQYSKVKQPPRPRSVHVGAPARGAPIRAAGNKPAEMPRRVEQGQSVADVAAEPRRRDMAGSVETTVRRSIHSGTTLLTPSQHKPFEIRLNSRGVVLLLGKKRTPTSLPWDCWEGIPDYLARKGPWVEIGGQYKVEGKRGTLDGYLKRWTKTATAGWVAVVLATSGVVEIGGERPACVRLTAAFAAAY